MARLEPECFFVISEIQFCFSFPPPDMYSNNFQLLFFYIEGVERKNKIVYHRLHCRFLEHRNRQNILSNIPQRFSCLLDEWIEKKCKKKIRDVFFEIHFSRFEMHMDRLDKSENIFGI